jgi:hypothetical protein
VSDNVDITAGTGTTIATDDCTTGQVQLTKLAYGANGDRTHVPADGDGLLVNLGANNDVTVTGTVTANLSATDNAVLDAIEADTTTLAGAVSGSEMQVDIVAALPAGANAIGKLAANSGIDIGDVDVTSVVPGTGATSLGKAVDSIPGGTDTGVAALAVRDDSLAALTPADGDYTQMRVNANGALWVIPSGTTVVSGTVTADLSATDNAVLDAIEADTTTIAGAVSGSEMQVDVITLPALPAGNNNIGDVDIVSVPAPLSTTGNGAAATALRVTIADDSTGVIAATVSGVATAANQSTGNTSLGTIAGAVAGTEMQVDIVAALPAGSNAIGKLAANSGVDIGDVDVATMVGSTVAHGGSEAGNPHKIGAVAETSPKGITLVSDGQRTQLHADADGILMVKIGTSGADLISERVTDTSGTSTAFTNFSAVASTYNYVTAITVYNSSTTAGTVDFRDGTGGSVKWTMPLPAGGGAIIGGSGTPLFKTSAATALAYDVSDALTTVTISVSGYQSKV